MFVRALTKTSRLQPQIRCVSELAAARKKYANPDVLARLPQMSMQQLIGEFDMTNADPQLHDSLAKISAIANEDPFAFIHEWKKIAAPTHAPEAWDAEKMEVNLSYFRKVLRPIPGERHPVDIAEEELKQVKADYPVGAIPADFDYEKGDSAALIKDLLVYKGKDPAAAERNAQFTEAAINLMREYDAMMGDMRTLVDTECAKIEKNLEDIQAGMDKNKEMLGLLLTGELSEVLETFPAVRQEIFEEIKENKWDKDIGEM
eukprot:CAMPEP_0177678496 /NCGR_PEP_ID=MMETSP0447-20121125/29040_1 /TAXON_ID=0 /ORGANISM="Stygamoeba regulata, Strain BSH-02190019" /LENGTH=259 /DNA_ID=CAMNT_0019187503 /DNA_START=119 /DNA_END=898 /DNA_ORIENTATION=+